MAHSVYLPCKVNVHIRPLSRRRGFLFILGYPIVCLLVRGVQLNEHNALGFAYKHITAKVTNEVDDR